MATKILPGSKVHSMLQIIDHCQGTAVEIPHNLFVWDVTNRAWKVGLVEIDDKNMNYKKTWTIHLTNLGEEALRQLNAGQYYLVEKIVNKRWDEK